MLKVFNDERVDVNVAVDISCTFESGLCGWHGNWSHDTLRGFSPDACQLSAARYVFSVFVIH